MPDLLNGFLKWIDHNRNLAAAIILTGVTAYTAFACTFSTPFQGEEVTSAELEQKLREEQSKLAARDAALQKRLLALQAEIAAIEVDQENLDLDGQLLLESAQLAREDIQRQKEEIQGLIAQIGDVAIGVATGDINTASLIGGVTAIGSVLTTIGVARDNRRKDGVIKKSKASE